MGLLQSKQEVQANDSVGPDIPMSKTNQEVTTNESLRSSIRVYEVSNDGKLMMIDELLNETNGDTLEKTEEEDMAGVFRNIEMVTDFLQPISDLTVAELHDKKVTPFADQNTFFVLGQSMADVIEVGENNMDTGIPEEEVSDNINISENFPNVNLERQDEPLMNNIVGEVSEELDNAERDPDFNPTLTAASEQRATVSNRKSRSRAKVLRLKGETYQGYKRSKEKVVTRISRDAKKLKDRCNHTELRKVTSKSFLCASVTERDRETIFDKFWKLETWNEKKLFVRNLVRTRPVRRRRKETKANDSSFKKIEGHDYFLNDGNGERLKVCHKMFINTLSLGEDCLKRWIKEGESDSGSYPADEEPSQSPPRKCKHKTRQTMLQKKLRDTVVEWLQLIPKVPSHYCRSSSSRQYVDNSLISKQNMYKLFKLWCSENERTATHLKAFKGILEENKISIFKPRKDQCDTCVGYKCGTVSVEVYNAHRAKEQAGREAKATMKASANEDNLVITMDLQSVLTCPKVLASSSYYKLKLQMHNFTIYALNNKKVSLYVWHEANGAVTSNEFTSCVIDYLLSSLDSHRKLLSFVLISDGCNYQNRNRVLASALNDFAFEKKVTIQQLFLEKGHTMMEADSVHSTLEHYFYPPINSPSDYVARMRLARPNLPYDVKVLDYTFFKKFEQPSNFQSIRPGKRARDPTVVDIRQIKYQPDGKVFYTLDYSQNWHELPHQRLAQEIESYKVPLYNKPIPISEEKYKHLQDLKEVIEKDHHPFYDALSHTKKKNKK